MASTGNVGHKKCRFCNHTILRASALCKGGPAPTPKNLTRHFSTISAHPTHTSWLCHCNTLFFLSVSLPHSAWLPSKDNRGTDAPSSTAAWPPAHSCCIPPPSHVSAGATLCTCTETGWWRTYICSTCLDST